MTRPQRYLIRMVIFVALTAAVIAVLLPSVIKAFMTNPALNAFIIGVLILGIVYIFRNVLVLYPEVTWIDIYRRSGPGLSVQRAPVLLGPLATMLYETGGRVSLSAMSMRYLLDAVASRLDESRDISRYMTGLLIFLGLLGTFWGLLETISSVGDAITSLSTLGESDFSQQFESLKKGLEQPLSGMGTSFSSSLFGLAGSLILGFLDLQAGQAQRRFFNDLEEWLSSITRLSGGAVADGEQSVPAYVSALLERTADTLGDLQRIVARTEEARSSSNTTLLEFAEKIATLADQMRTEQDLMVKLVETQMEIKPVLQRLAGLGERDGGFDQASRTHLRNLDVSIRRLLEELAQGRAELVQDLRGEIKVLARTIATLVERR
ncbi:MAG: flagellar motor protein MotA [Alphaproteobacteria bacterium]|nr:flagellar motor protein MotA [Alphaproteobacteria bacterium]